ncbi:heterokaryon incompatibility protein-domain-containing protein [Apiosordaria backusii]|uniref:Heterokaryon incompatibility protein-domain-containing protein n=1 Tax=Apiosordaria backusii TaxID=314023 RepID=A0AA40E8S8_9PEZI|nr:heterokaryon incompatibility protein-domain-containing protein [Apiosordaria backusii]
MVGGIAGAPVTSFHLPRRRLYRYMPLMQRCHAYDYTIRLLHLLPSADDTAPLRCRLTEKGYNDHWDNDPHHDYHALSYTWGEPIFPGMLEVLSNGKLSGNESLGAIPITQNLQSALQHLRKRDTTLILWVDAVCINQADVTERNSQVTNMPKIYKKASSAVVWLGDESPLHDARLCMGFFESLRILSTNSNQNVQSASWRKRFEINRLVASFLGACNAVIIYFLERPWFRRRWIVQEVVLAKTVTIHCGPWNILWDTFHLAMFELFENDQGVFTTDHRTTMRTMTGVRNGGHSITAVRNIGLLAKKQLPLDTLVEFSAFLCADPRDRLYALYGVIKRWCPRQVTMQLAQINVIDYSLPTEQIFTNFATGLIQIDTRTCRPLTSDNAEYRPVTHVLQLAAAFGHQDPTQNHLCGKIPSWVVDWTGALCFEPLHHSPTDHVACKAITREQIQFLPTKENPRLLVIIGLPFDIVTASISLDVRPMLLTSTVHKAKWSLNHFLSKVADHVDGDFYEPTYQHLITALAITLVASWEHTPKNSYFGQDPRFITDFLRQLECQQYHLPELLHKWPAYVELMALTMRGRSLFLTAKGYMGIAATGVTTGDVVCLLDNQSVPFVVRPERAAKYTVQDGERGAVHLPDCSDYQLGMFELDVAELGRAPSLRNTFGLVSDAYVHGLMKGEAFEVMEKAGADLPLKILPIA